MRPRYERKPLQILSYYSENADTSIATVKCPNLFGLYNHMGGGLFAAVDDLINACR